MKFQSINFTCKSCGAPLRYSPLSSSLSCEFCSTKESISDSKEMILEYDFQEALRFLKSYRAKEITKEVKCAKCAVIFELTPYSISSNCPYCNTPAITDFVKEITPKSILPFTLDHSQAKDKFKQWIGSLWFAPNKLKKFLKGDEKLKGYYLPHWTYDSQTQTYYQGKRGDIYYVTVRRVVTVNGRDQEIEEQEQRIRWTPVSGEIRDDFDDITVGASKTVSHTILENLAPWDTTKLIPFDKKYLSGFESEEYTIGLDSSFEYAKEKMNRVIKEHIKKDIGGDRQEISSVNTTHNNTTYKNALFPIWTAEFKWKGKSYNYAINAQSGKVTGERPYSWVKITLIIISVLALLGAGIYFGVDN